MESIKRVINFILYNYNSLLLCLISTWLAVTLFTVGHPVIGALLLVVVVIKMIGMIYTKDKLRVIGMIGLNSMWAVNVYVFISGYHPTVELSFHFPLFILLLGMGISLRGRFDE